MNKGKKSLNKTGTSGEPTKSVDTLITFKPLELEGALLGTYDLMTRVLLQDEMIATHDTARCIRENLWLQGDGIDLAIPKRHITESVRKTLGEWLPDPIEDSGFTTKINGVPVRMQFITGDYDYFKMSDMRPYGAEFYRIPNQWDEYWKHREEVV